MATKTISLRLEAYEELCAARSFPGESFSQVVLRATWPEESCTGGELLDRWRALGPRLSEEALDRLEERQVSDRPPEAKWRR